MKNTLILLVLIFTISCTSKNGNSDNKDNKGITDIKGTPEVLVINAPELVIKNKIKLSEICDSIWYVKLESNAESMIGKIDKIIVNDENIILADYWIIKGVFIFDEKGKFMTKISRFGKGPFEYARIADVCYWPPTKSIFIFDGDGRKIIEYDITGKPLKEIHLSFYARRMALVDNANFVFYAGYTRTGSINSNLIYVNNKGEIIEKAIPIDNRIKIDYSSDNPFYNYQNRLYFAPDFDQNIYCINKDSISYRYSIDFMGRNIPSDLLFNKTFDELSKEIANNKLLYFDNPFESENYFYVCVNDLNFAVFQYIYSKKDKIGRFFYNTISDLPNSFTNVIFLGNSGDNFYGIIDTDKMLLAHSNLQDNKLKIQKSSTTDNLIRNYKETDNPVLCFCRINISNN